MQMTIRDRIIHTGNIALAGDSFRFAEPGAWIRAPTRRCHHVTGVRRPGVGPPYAGGRAEQLRFGKKIRVFPAKSLPFAREIWYNEKKRIRGVDDVD
jgi:hypothetical protein